MHIVDFYSAAVDAVAEALCAAMAAGALDIGGSLPGSAALPPDFRLGKGELVFTVPMEISASAGVSPIECCGILLRYLPYLKECPEIRFYAGHDGSLRARPDNSLFYSLFDGFAPRAVNYAKGFAVPSVFEADIPTEAGQAMAFRIALAGDNLFRLHHYLGADCALRIIADKATADMLSALGISSDCRDLPPDNIVRISGGGDASYRISSLAPQYIDRPVTDISHSRFFLNIPFSAARPLAEESAALLHTRKNPLYNLRYAHKRSHDLGNMREAAGSVPVEGDAENLLFCIAAFPVMLKTACKSPWHLRKYSGDLADSFFEYYLTDSAAHPEICRLVHEITGTLLELMGISPEYRYLKGN